MLFSCLDPYIVLLCLFVILVAFALHLLCCQGTVILFVLCYCKNTTIVLHYNTVVSLLIVVVPLRPGKSNPYCELTMGPQCYTSRSVADTLNPKWNFNCQFFIKDIYQDVLCITVLEKEQFSPDGRWIRRQHWPFFK